jgi:hypothetical protein
MVLVVLDAYCLPLCVIIKVAIVMLQGGSGHERDRYLQNSSKLEFHFITHTVRP